jgi:hypothetical protein
MEYQNYLIVFKEEEVDSNIFIKFKNKNSNISYENIITSQQINNLPINKFVKILENSINSIPNYNIIIELSPDENQLIVFLSYDTNIINISHTIHLEKTSNNQVKSNDILINRIEQLERINEENNKITIAKILNVETYNYNMSSLTCNYIKYSKNAEHIEIILPKNTHDISRDKRNNYEIKFNYDIDPNDIFTNLKKITISDYNYLFYFCHFCSLKIPSTGVILSMSNNSIEEIEFMDDYNDFHCFLQPGQKFLESVFSDGLHEILNKQKYIKNDNKKSVHNRYNSDDISVDFPNLKKIISSICNGPNNLYGILEFIKACKKNNRSKKLNKLILKKIIYQGFNEYSRNYLCELRNVCKDNQIELEIGEIIY